MRSQGLNVPIPWCSLEIPCTFGPCGRGVKQCFLNNFCRVYSFLTVKFPCFSSGFPCIQVLVREVGTVFS